jgi:hypothetical protein
MSVLWSLANPHKPWDKRVLKIFRILAPIFTVVAGTLTVINFLQGRHLLQQVQMPSIEIVTKWELRIQAGAVLCLLGFVLEALPKVREHDWFKDSESSKIEEIFGTMSTAERQDRVRNTVEAARQLWGSWIFLWAMWLALYAIWLFAPPPEAKVVTNLTAIGDVFNMLSAAAFFLCYFVMTRHTTPSKQVGFPPIAFFTIVVFGLTAAIAFVYQGKPVSLLDPVHWMAGLASGVTMALFVGRLESGLMRLSPYLIAAFYAYAMIQVSYPELPKQPWVFLVMTSCALIFKVLLFWQLRRILSSGAIYWYMFEYRKAYDAGTEQRDIFLKRLLA